MRAAGQRLAGDVGQPAGGPIGFGVVHLASIAGCGTAGEGAATILGGTLRQGQQAAGAKMGDENPVKSAYIVYTTLV